MPEWIGGGRVEQLALDSDQNLQKWFVFCRKTNHVEALYRQCLVEQMRIHQVSQLRVTFAKFFGGWIRSVRSVENIVFVTADVLRFNQTRALVMLSPSGTYFDLDDISLKQWLWQSVLKVEPSLRQYPGARLGDAEMPDGAWYHTKSNDLIVLIHYPVIHDYDSYESVPSVILRVKVSPSGIRPHGFRRIFTKPHRVISSFSKGKHEKNNLPVLGGNTPLPGLVARMDA